MPHSYPIRNARARLQGPCGGKEFADQRRVLAAWSAFDAGRNVDRPGDVFLVPKAIVLFVLLADNVQKLVVGIDDLRFVPEPNGLFVQGVDGRNVDHWSAWFSAMVKSLCRPRYFVLLFKLIPMELANSTVVETVAMKKRKRFDLSAYALH